MECMITTDDGVAMRPRTYAATSHVTVRNRATAGIQGSTTGELRLVPPAMAATDDVFAPLLGTGVPGGPPA